MWHSQLPWCHCWLHRPRCHLTWGPSCWLPCMQWPPYPPLWLQCWYSMWAATGHSSWATCTPACSSGCICTPHPTHWFLHTWSSACGWARSSVHASPSSWRWPLSCRTLWRKREKRRARAAGRLLCAGLHEACRPRRTLAWCSAMALQPFCSGTHSKVGASHTTRQKPHQPGTYSRINMGAYLLFQMMQNSHSLNLMPCSWQMAARSVCVAARHARSPARLQNPLRRQTQRWARLSWCLCCRAKHLQCWPVCSWAALWWVWQWRPHSWTGFGCLRTKTGQQVWRQCEPCSACSVTHGSSWQHP